VRLFGRKTADVARCPDCNFFMIVASRGYCTRGIPASVNARLLSEEGIKRQCPRCPSELTCADWQAR